MSHGASAISLCPIGLGRRGEGPVLGFRDRAQETILPLGRLGDLGKDPLVLGRDVAPPDDQRQVHGFQDRLDRLGGRLRRTVALVGVRAHQPQVDQVGPQLLHPASPGSRVRPDVAVDLAERGRPVERGLVEHVQGDGRWMGRLAVEAQERDARLTADRHGPPARPSLSPRGPDGHSVDSARPFLFHVRNCHRGPPEGSGFRVQGSTSGFRIGIREFSVSSRISRLLN